MKNVNIKPTTPVHGAFTQPLVSEMRNYRATEDQIYRCLIGGAFVEEILSSGKTVVLDFTNYNKDNSQYDKTVLKQETVQPQIKEDIKEQEGTKQTNDDTEELSDEKEETESDNSQVEDEKSKETEDTQLSMQPRNTNGKDRGTKYKRK